MRRSSCICHWNWHQAVTCILHIYEINTGSSIVMLNSTLRVVLALEHMHRKKVVYRDMKPENILLGESGYPKVADFGLAKVVIGKTFTKCGTVEYLAPEVIAQSGHDHSVDWWMLGILSYELMCGQTPFRDSSEACIYERINKGIKKVRFPPAMEPPTRRYVKAMCASDPAERLPRKKGGVDNIRSHEWYDGFDWIAMRAHKLTAPHCPKAQSRKDMESFLGRESKKPDVIPYHDDGTGWDKNFATATVTWSREGSLIPINC